MYHPSYKKNQKIQLKQLNARVQPEYESENSFGARMMAKMGWEEGKGLGANENGITSFIKTKFKNNNDGIGFTEKDDGWTQHDADFGKLLENLNGEDITDADLLADRASLEEKSKSSRARVHYKKFTRGKDLSKYSEKDLANIFGKKSLISSKAEANDDDSDEVPQNKEKILGGNTVETGVTINDYFKSKYDQKLKSQNGNRTSTCISNDVDSNSSSSDSPQEAINKTEAIDDSSLPDESNMVKKKKKKSKKNKTLEEEKTDNQEDSQALEEISETSSKKKCKKSKKSKEENENSIGTDISPPVLQSVESPDVSDSAIHEKKKKKKSAVKDAESKTVTIADDTESPNPTELEDNSASKSTNSKKKKKKRLISTEEHPLDNQNSNGESSTTDTNSNSMKMINNKTKRVKINTSQDICEMDVEETTEDTAKQIESEMKQPASKDNEFTEPKLTEAVKPDMSAEMLINKNRWLKMGMSITEEEEKVIFSKYAFMKKVSVEVNNDKLQINPIVAEKLRQVDLSKFINCNIGSIQGYGVEEDIKIEVKSKGVLKNSAEDKYELYNRLEAFNSGRHDKLKLKKSKYKTKNIFTII